MQNVVRPTLVAMATKFGLGAEIQSPIDSAVIPRWLSAAVLDFYRTGNSAIRYTDAENPCLEPNMEWIRCTVCEIFTFKLYCDLEIGVRVTQGHRKRHYSIEHIRLYILLP